MFWAKKVAKFDKGRPGVSRSKANQKRKETLLVEYNQRGKVNTLKDRRLGENTDMNVEEKMLQRFALERQKSHGKAGTFNLNDDDELTHYGQSLSQIENFDEPISSDDDEDEERGKIGAKMVAEEHFGGGMLKNTDESDTRHKTWKERMEEIISKSKKEKYERQHEKEKYREQTQQLDQEWKELQSAMSQLKKGKHDETDEKRTKTDDYDIAVRELHFEMKGQATDRMKTEEEIASDEKQKLEKLEADRLRRMKGITADEEEERTRQRKHMSADDLDDGFSLESRQKKKYEVKYDDGKLIGDNEDSSDGEESEDEGEDLDEGNKGNEDNDATDDESDSDSSGDDAMAHLSDLESESDEESEDDSNEKDTEEKAVKKEIKKVQSSSQSKEVGKKDIKEILKKKKIVMEEARKELPYTFKAPDTYDELLELLKDHDTIDKIIIIERTRSCHHPSLAEGNKTKLETLFQLLLQYYGELALQQPPDLRLIDKLVIHLYELAQQGAVSAGKTVLDVVLAKQGEYQEKCEARNGKGIFPSLDTLLYFKLVSILFPTSDLQHPVVTPTLLFMSQVITQSSVQTTRDVACGLLLCNIFLEYVTFSKRFVPEAINFLRGLLFLCIDKSPAKIEPVIPPFKPVGKFNDILKIKSNKISSEQSVGPMNLLNIFTPQKAMKYLSSDEFRISSIKLTISLLQRFSSLYKSLASYKEIFEPICYFCKKLPTDVYPKVIQESVLKLTNDIEETSKKNGRKPLTMAKKKTKALHLYEPKIAEDFDPTRKSHNDCGKEKNEKQRLVHKHKRELKGAIREIRKDTQFLGKEKLRDQISRDDERKRKVRELIGSLASQEGDYQSMKRQKSKT